MGRSKEICILTREMLESRDSLCRASSANLMQMSFHHVKQEVLCEKAKSTFYQRICAEKELFACDVMIETAQILFGQMTQLKTKRLKKIEKARKSAVRFLSKS